MSHTLLLIPIGVLTGVLSGLLGVGGGFLLVPLLTLLGWPLHHAIGTSLLYVALLGLGGAWSHLRGHNLDKRLVVAMSLPAMVGAQAGAFGTTLLSASLLDAVFAGGTLLAALQMMRPLREGTPEASAPSTWRAAALGLGVGALSGLLGVGGGLFLVPGQVQWLRVPLKRAVGNRLAVIVLTGASGVVGHAWLGHVDGWACLWLAAGGFAGLWVGLLWLTRFESPVLQRLFVVFLMGVAIAMGARALMASHSGDGQAAWPATRAIEPSAMRLGGIQL